MSYYMVSAKITAWRRGGTIYMFDIIHTYMHACIHTHVWKRIWKDIYAKVVRLACLGR